MPRRASAVFVATLLAGIAGTILRMPSGAVAASSPARQENPAAVAFERWLNAQAEQALAAGREARAAIRTADDVRRR